MVQRHLLNKQYYKKGLILIYPGFQNEAKQYQYNRLIEEFKKTHKATCCRVLSAGFDFHSPERKSHCTNMVYDCAKILENILEKESQTEKV